MKKIFLFIFSCFVSFPGFSNKGEDIGRGVTKVSTATVTKVVPNKTHLEDVVLTVMFKCPGDACSKKNIKMFMNKNPYPVKLTKKNEFVHIFKPGRFRLEFTGNDFYSASTDTINFEKGTKVFVTVEFQIVQKNMTTRKPVIYLYPIETTEVNVQLDYHGGMEFTYPQYTAGGWDVKASPDGTLEADGKQFNYLFWDGKMDQGKLKPDFTKGWVIESQHLTTFLENTLEQIGLNSKETADFITYWVPIMQQNEKNYIHFLLNENYNQVANIHVSPEPDQMLRVFMLWTKAENNMPDVLPQVFAPFKRNGFTLIEWGGAEYDLHAK